MWCLKRVCKLIQRKDWEKNARLLRKGPSVLSGIEDSFMKAYCSLLLSDLQNPFTYSL